MNQNNVVRFPSCWKQFAELANKFHRLKKWQKAIDYYDAAMAIHPDKWSPAYGILVAARDLCSSMITPVWYDDVECED